MTDGNPKLEYKKGPVIAGGSLQRGGGEDASAFVKAGARAFFIGVVHKFFFVWNSPFLKDMLRRGGVEWQWPSLGPR